MSETTAARGLWLQETWQGRATPLARAGLGMAAVAYRAALAARSAAYGIGLLSTRGLPVPVISVGNVTVGGSGKTPLAEHVVRCLGKAGVHPAVISRGYGRRSRGVRIVADGTGIRLAARDGGDEPVLLAERLPGVPVVVGESRYEAGVVAVEACGAGALVLDDGFQHRTLAKDLEIVVISGADPWGNGRLFPRGPLREPLSALKRAAVAVITNPPTPEAASEISRVLGRAGSVATVLSGVYQPTALWQPTSSGPGDGDRAGAPRALAGRRVLALAGLASPRGFVATAATLGMEITGVADFPDHHWYTPGDLARVAAQARETGAEAVVTTEKDWIRLREMPRGSVPLWVLSIRLDMGTDQSALAQALGEAMRRAAGGRRTR